MMRTVMKHAACGAIILLSTGAAWADDCSVKATTAIETLGQDDQLMISAEVGKTGANFYFDLASGVSFLHRDVADQMGIRTTAPAGNASPATARMVGIVPSLKIADLENRNFSMEIADQPSDPPLGAVGTLGIGVLESRDLELDLLHKRMALFLQDHCTGHVVYWSDTAVQVPLNLGANGDVTVQMALDGKPVRVALDSLQEESWMDVAALQRLFGPAATAQTYKISDLNAGGLSIRHPNISIISQNPLCKAAVGAGAVPGAMTIDDERCADLHIGMGILRQLRLFFAFKERKLYITAAQ